MTSRGAPDRVGPWSLQRAVGRAGELHAASGRLLEGAGPGGRIVRVLHAERPAVVLGAAQPGSDVDAGRAARLGVDIARRRSGGGAVLVGPGESLWVDVAIPRGDPLWSDDVGTAMAWIGEAWVSALDAVGAGPAERWAGRLVSSPWSDKVCFAGVGPGEVLRPPAGAAGSPAGVAGSPAGRPQAPSAAAARPTPPPPARRPGVPFAGRGLLGPKVVGISQRRTRAGALFQTAALLRWRPLDLLDVLVMEPAERARAADQLAGVAQAVGGARSCGGAAAGELLDAFLGALPPGAQHGGAAIRLP